MGMNGDIANSPPGPQAQRDLAELETLLAFHMEAGADWVLDEAPHDRFAERDDPAPKFAPQWASTGATVAPTATTAAPPPQRDDAPPTPRQTLAAPVAAPQAARKSTADLPTTDLASADLTSDASALAVQAGALARAATTLDELKQAMERFDGCSLKRTASQLVFADGAPDARIMLVGEAPGAEEDRIGTPFVGRLGQLLDRMLAAIGLDRSNVFIANTVPWRPPGNRTPTPQESAICRPFIERQIELVNPDVLVCLGGPSAQALLGIREGILRVRGRWAAYDMVGRQIRALPTLHPAYLLRSPLQKRLAWRDFRAIRKALDEAGA